MNYRDVSLGEIKTDNFTVQTVKLSAISLFENSNFIKYSHVFVYLMTISYPVLNKITSSMFSRHYDVNNVTKHTNLNYENT